MDTVGLLNSGVNNVRTYFDDYGLWQSDVHIFLPHFLSELHVWLPPFLQIFYTYKLFGYAELIWDIKTTHVVAVLILVYLHIAREYQQINR